MTIESHKFAVSKRTDSFECKPLLDAATKDLFRKNAFRITGLPVDATIREIAKHADKIKMLVELGQDPHTEGAAFPIKPPPTLDEIREAIQKLKDPEKRLIDEFFWFWPEEFGKSQSEAEMRALTIGDLESASAIWSSKEEHPTAGVTAKHNLALVFHIAALDWENYSVKTEVETEQRKKISDYWKQTFKRWERLATDETFWEKVTARIRQLNEPNLLPGFARRMRATLPEALDKINAELAVAFAESGKIELARLHVQFMRETNQGLDNVEKTAELVLTPARNRLKEQIQQAKDRGDKNPNEAANAARDLLEQARQTMALFDLFFGMESILRNELSDELASVCNRLVIAYDKKTDDYKTSLDILKVVLPFAASVELSQLIKTNVCWFTLSVISNSEDHPRARLNQFIFEAIPVPPNTGTNSNSNSETGLFNHAAAVLRGISLAAWNNFQDSATAIGANDLAIKYACEPDLKQRLLLDRVTLKKNAEQQPKQIHLGTELGYGARTRLFVNPEIPQAAEQRKQESSNKVGIGCLVLVAMPLVFGIIGSCNSTNNSSSSPFSARPTYTNTSTPTYTPPPTFSDGNSDAKRYRVPSSVSSTLASEKAEIEADRTTLGALETQVETLGREIDRDRLYIDRTSQFAIDEFNAKVGGYNALAQKAKTVNAAFNEKVDNYNAKLRQNGR